MKRLVSDRSGLAGIEFALASTALTVGLLNGLEVARWSFERMEVANAVHSATLAVWNACDTKHLPAKTNCSGLTTAITNGLATTSLTTDVTIASGYPTEAYYCLNSSKVLTSGRSIYCDKTERLLVGWRCDPRAWRLRRHPGQLSPTSLCSVTA